MGRMYIIEGIDGSGKTTQTALLKERLEIDGNNVLQVKFPQYDKPSCALVEMYLAGQFGNSPEDVNAYAASSFYAVDRFASYKLSWGKDYNEGKIIVSDRYVTSNLIHQCSKLPPEKRLDYMKWLYDFEFDKLGLPVPDGVFFLDVSPEVSHRQMMKRYGGDAAKCDIHERDESYLWRCYEAAVYACDLGYMTRINCTDNGEMLSIEAINDSIYYLVKGE